MTATRPSTETRVSPGESIQRALDACEPGAVVRLDEGVYEGSVCVTKAGVRLVGAGSGRTVIVPGEVAPSSVPPLHDAPEGVVSGITVHAVDGVRVTGLTVRGFTGAGVYAHTVTDLRLDDVVAAGNRVWGLYVRESSGAEVLRCRAEGSQYAGIGLSFCPQADAEIADCLTTGNAFGVFVDNSSHARVVRNSCRGNAAGVMLLNQTYEGELPGGVADVLVADNDLVANTLASGGDDPEALGAAGPPISGVGIAAVGVQRVAVIGNRVHGNLPSGPSVMGAAVVLASSAEWGGSDSTDNSFEWNVVTGNGPVDLQVGTDPGNQRFRNNIVGVAQPEIDGCAPRAGR